MPFTLPTTSDTLFTDYNSIASLMGVTGLTLRLDDNMGTASVITAASNASPIVITSAAHGLTTGNQVQVVGVGGNTAANGLWTITVVTSGTFSLDGSVGLAAYTSGGVWLRVDPSDGADTLAVIYAANVGTAWVKRFTQSLYDTADLADSWSVWNWATIKAAHWIAARRNNPIPTSLNNLYLEAIDELQEVRAGSMQIEDIGYRNELLPTWSALRIDHRYTIKKLRVEGVLSNRNTPQYPQKQDIGSLRIGPGEPDRI